MSRSDKKWLVRSSNHILGPYNIEEIEQLLVDGNLSITDEVTSSCTFWSSFLGHPEFDQFIKQISFQARVTSGLAKITKELSFSKSQTAVSETNTIDKIQTFTQKIKNKKSVDKVKDAVFETVKEESAQKPEAVTYYSKEKSQTVVNTRVQSFMSFTWKTIIIFTIIGIGYILYAKFFKPLK